MAADLFVNAAEGRPRAFWRILIQGILFFAGLPLVDFLLSLLQPVLGPVLATILSQFFILLWTFFTFWVAIHWLDHRPLRAFGFHFSPRWWLNFIFGLALGALLMAFIFLVERSAGWITVTGIMQSKSPTIGFWTGIPVKLFNYICVGIYEEMIFRGYHLRNLSEGLNFKSIKPRTAVLLAYLFSSAIFGLMHLSTPNASLVSTLNLIAAGLFLGLAYVLTGELAVPIGLHITWNFFQGNVFGFPVSGSTSGFSFIAIQQGGPAAWTGGAYGPEAGLMGLLAYALGCALIALWLLWQKKQLRLEADLAVYQSAKQAALAAPAADAESRRTSSEA